MNFGLNKIDTDIRRKVHEKTSDGKVHCKEAVLITKDEENNRDKTFDKCLQKQKDKLKDKTSSPQENEVIEVKCEIDVASMRVMVGNFLDVKK